MRSSARRFGCGLVAALALLLGWAAPALSQVYEVKGLRLGMTLLEAQLIYPDLEVKMIPYEDENVGTDYEPFYGRLAPLRYEGQFLVERGKSEGFRMEVVFTGRPELYALQASILDPSLNCNSAIARVAARYGPAMIDDRPEFASWRQVVVIGPEMIVRCLDDGKGLYTVILRQNYIQELYLQDLMRDLRPAIEAAIQYLG